MTEIQTQSIMKYTMNEEGKTLIQPPTQAVVNSKTPLRPPNSSSHFSFTPFIAFVRESTESVVLSSISLPVDSSALVSVESVVSDDDVSGADSATSVAKTGNDRHTASAAAARIANSFFK